MTSPYAMNVDSNYVKFGYDVAKGIVDGLGGKGNVLRVEGIAGSPLVAQQRAARTRLSRKLPTSRSCATSTATGRRT